MKSLKASTSKNSTPATPEKCRKLRSALNAEKGSPKIKLNKLSKRHSNRLRSSSEKRSAEGEKQQSQQENNKKDIKANDNITKDKAKKEENPTTAKKSSEVVNEDKKSEPVMSSNNECTELTPKDEVKLSEKSPSSGDAKRKHPAKDKVTAEEIVKKALQDVKKDKKVADQSANSDEQETKRTTRASANTVSEPEQKRSKVPEKILITDRMEPEEKEKRIQAAVEQLFKAESRKPRECFVSIIL